MTISASAGMTHRRPTFFGGADSDGKEIFDHKIQELEKQKIQFEKALLAYPVADFATDAQIFKNWTGLRNAFNIVIQDIGKNGTYHILGANAGDDVEKAIQFFSQIGKKFKEKNIHYKAIHPLNRKHEAEAFIKKNGKKWWNIKYYDLVGPFEIGIAKNYPLLILLEKEPIVLMIHNKKVRDSFLQYFDIIWKQSKR